MEWFTSIGKWADVYNVYSPFLVMITTPNVLESPNKTSDLNPIECLGQDLQIDVHI